MSWESDKASELLELAAQRLAEGKAQMAAATLCRAFDVLDRAPDQDPEINQVRVSILGQLFELRTAADTAQPLQERAAHHVPLLLRHPQLADQIVRWFAVERGEKGPDALELYVRFLEAGGRIESELSKRIHEILSKNLVIHLTTTDEEAEPIVPLLERLHAKRPQLTYPRLYLGRWHYLADRYEEASNMLSELQGPLADRPKVLNILARCAEKLGRREEALALFERSLEKNDKQPNIHYRAARLLLDDCQREETSAVPPSASTTTSETPLPSAG